MKHNLLFLGTGAGCGVPSFFCSCVACLEAQQDKRFSRSRCSVLVKNKQYTLIDAAPDLRYQLMKQQITKIDNFILTHWHYDHTGGLGELEFYVRVGTQQAIPAYMTQLSKEWLQQAFAFMDDCFFTQTVGPGWQFEIDDIKYTALEVTHSAGTIGLLMETSDGHRCAYIPDTGPLPQSTQQMVYGIDTLILGSTFWGNNWMPEDHLSVDQAVQIGLQSRAKKVYLTHLSMHHDIPVTNQQLEEYLRNYGDHLHLAYDGLYLEL